MLHGFNNAPGNPIQVCLAPILNIRTFIVRELDSLRVVDINMFLVSRAHPSDGDIVDNLLRVRRDGAIITVKVDGEQYRGDASGYMPDALAPLQAAGVEVYAVSKRSEKMRTRTKMIDTIPQFHDKLVLIRHADDSRKVFIGSAGFTDNVQDNLNLENMVLLKISSVYERLLAHFAAINSSRGNLEVTRL